MEIILSSHCLFTLDMVQCRSGSEEFRGCRRCQLHPVSAGNFLTLLFSDVKKMPLGKLSKSQINKGLEVLMEIETAIKDRKVKLQIIIVCQQNWG